MRNLLLTVCTMPRQTPSNAALFMLLQCFIMCAQAFVIHPTYQNINKCEAVAPQCMKNQLKMIGTDSQCDAMKMIQEKQFINVYLEPKMHCDVVDIV